MTGWQDTETEASTPLALVRGCQAELAGTMRLARGLVGRGLVVDLTGLDRRVGLLCAKTLDLPPEEARRMRSGLLVLLADVEALVQALDAAHGPAR